MTAMKIPIYLDYSATTPVDPRVAQKLIPYLTEHFGNPASRSHSFGWTAEKAVEEAREHVAALVNCDSREIVWTSGATESINLALKGAAHFYKDKGKHLVTVRTEHKATLDTVRELEREACGDPSTCWRRPARPRGSSGAAAGHDRRFGDGRHQRNRRRQDIPAIGDVSRRGISSRDAAQATGKVAIDLAGSGRPDVLLAQELRSGRRALRPAQAARAHRGADARRRPRARHALGHAADTPDRRHGRVPDRAAEMGVEIERIRMLRDKLWKGLSEIEEVYVNGDLERRVPHNLNVSFNFVEGESLIMAIKDVAVSSGSACTSASLEPSYVLRALGRSDELAHSSIRFSVGRFTSEAEIAYTVDLLQRKVAKLRELSPLWEMNQEGVDLDTVQWAAH
jgi:cysteine desulfurase